MVKLLPEIDIVHAYQNILILNPKTSANSIIAAAKDTNTAMRRQDALVLIKNLKRSLLEVEGVTSRNKNTNMTPRTQKRIKHEALNYSRKESLFISKQKSTLKSRQAAVKGKKAGSVKDLERRMYNKQSEGAKDEYFEFYG